MKWQKALEESSDDFASGIDVVSWRRLRCRASPTVMMGTTVEIIGSINGWIVRIKP